MKGGSAFQCGCQINEPVLPSVAILSALVMTCRMTIEDTEGVSTPGILFILAATGTLQALLSATLAYHTIWRAIKLEFTN